MSFVTETLGHLWITGRPCIIWRYGIPRRIPRSFWYYYDGCEERGTWHKLTCGLDQNIKITNCHGELFAKNRLETSRQTSLGNLDIEEKLEAVPKNWLIWSAWKCWRGVLKKMPRSFCQIFFALAWKLRRFS